MTLLFVMFSTLWVATILATLLIPFAYSHDPLDPFGSIAIKWDITGWNDDGYMATVSIYNNQKFRSIRSYALGWIWGNNEVIITMSGARATDQGDCSRVPSPPPHSCRRDPTIIDLPPGVPYSQQVANCCRDGMIEALSKDRQKSLSSFSLNVGSSGNSVATVAIPRNFTFRSPGPGYTCSPFREVAPTRFPSSDGKRFTQAYLTWNATCRYSQYVAHKAPTCCVAFSAFYSDKIVSCPNCACKCRPPNVRERGPHPLPGTDSTSCISPFADYRILEPLATGLASHKAAIPRLYCTNDMCPVKIHWHLKANYKQHWRAKLTITNRNFAQNYSNWNVVVQQPNFGNFTEAFSFTHKALKPYGNGINDTAMFWGIQNFNEILLQAGPKGNLQSELLFAKDSSFTLSHGWGFPSRVLFNGDECVLPNPQLYPALPSGTNDVGLPLLFYQLAFSIALALQLIFLGYWLATDFADCPVVKSV